MAFKKNHIQLNSGRTRFKKGHIPWNKGKKGIRVGKIASNWQGGKILHNGYWYIFKPDHFRANKQGYVKRCILVMESIIGRYLDKKEIIHHIDSNIENDNKNNLKLFKNHSEHMKYHFPKRSRWGKNLSRPNALKFRKEKP